jgi:hypothetical protein
MKFRSFANLSPNKVARKPVNNIGFQRPPPTFVPSLTYESFKNRGIQELKLGCNQVLSYFVQFVRRFGGSMSQVPEGGWFRNSISKTRSRSDSSESPGSSADRHRQFAIDFI